MEIKSHDSQDMIRGQKPHALKNTPSLPSPSALRHQQSVMREGGRTMGGLGESKLQSYKKQGESENRSVIFFYPIEAVPWSSPVQTNTRGFLLFRRT